MYFLWRASEAENEIVDRIYLTLPMQFNSRLRRHSGRKYFHPPLFQLLMGRPHNHSSRPHTLTSDRYYSFTQIANEVVGVGVKTYNYGNRRQLMYMLQPVNSNSGAQWGTKRGRILEVGQNFKSKIKTEETYSGFCSVCGKEVLFFRSNDIYVKATKVKCIQIK